MNCDQLSKQFSDYLVGDLDEKLTSKVEQHLTSCTKCQAEYGRLKQTWEKLDELPEFEPSESLQLRFQDMLEAFQAGRRRLGPTPGARLKGQHRCRPDQPVPRFHRRASEASRTRSS